MSQQELLKKVIQALDDAAEFRRYQRLRLHVVSSLPVNNG